jgi:hypothetical protein
VKKVSQELVLSDFKLFSPSIPLLAVLPSFYPTSFLFPLLQCHSLWDLQNLQNIIIMDACAYQAVLYQTLSQHIAPMAIRLILVSFSRPAMVGNWRVSPNRAKCFSTVMSRGY